MYRSNHFSIAQSILHSAGDNHFSHVPNRGFGIGKHTFNKLASQTYARLIEFEVFAVKITKLYYNEIDNCDKKM